MVKALILAAILLAGCVPPTLVEDPRQVWCDTNSPRDDATETTPRDEIDEINAHNFKGQAWCGWSPP